MRTEEEYQALYQSRYKLQRQLKAEILRNEEREKRAKKTRLDLMLQLNRWQHAYEVLEDNYHALLQIRRPVDKPESEVSKVVK